MLRNGRENQTISHFCTVRFDISPFISLRASICGLDIEDIVASNEDLAEKTCKISVHKFFSLVETEVHVCIRRGKNPLVLLTPLEPNANGLPGQIGNKGLWIDNKL